MNSFINAKQFVRRNKRIRIAFLHYYSDSESFKNLNHWLKIINLSGVNSHVTIGTDGGIMGKVFAKR